jgi:hypothetical protein
MEDIASERNTFVYSRQQCRKVSVDFDNGASQAWIFICFFEVIRAPHEGPCLCCRDLFCVCRGAVGVERPGETE